MIKSALTVPIDAHFGQGKKKYRQNLGVSVAKKNGEELLISSLVRLLILLRFLFALTTLRIPMEVILPACLLV
jgi:hypothetical protein